MVSHLQKLLEIFIQNLFILPFLFLFPFLIRNFLRRLFHIKHKVKHFPFNLRVWGRRHCTGRKLGGRWMLINTNINLFHHSVLQTQSYYLEFLSSDCELGIWWNKM